ncbi:MAG: Crp/Fnr family transcriptional regulator [Burkholderiaceae bacterium]|nr:Crp/Fnr family transcriptional regulator [Burkholderiaceae bacterium]
MAVSLDVVRKIPLFEGLDEESLSAVAQQMTARTYLSHDIVLRKGDTSEHLAFLLLGKLQVVDTREDGRETGLHFVMPGAYFGELSVIDGQPRSAAVISVQLSEVAFLPAHYARELIFNHPLIAQRFMMHFAKIVRASSNQRTLLSIPNAFQRVYAQLHLLARETQDGQVIEGLPKQHEIAIMVNTSRETVSRALHTLLKSNILAKKGPILIVKRPELLKNAAAAGLEALPAAKKSAEPVDS